MNSSAATPSISSLPYAKAVELRSIETLKPHTRNARKHSAKQIRQIADSIKAFGFTNPILIGAGDEILAGHGRVQAAKRLGYTDVPTLQLDHLDDAQRRAYLIADNRLAEQAGWDESLLALEFGELLDLNFDVQLTGFDTADIDRLLNPMITEDEDLIEPDFSPVVTSRRGDLWLLGGHRLWCGDATEKTSYVCVVGDAEMQMVFTDPPYNVPIQGHVSGTKRHAEFAMATGEMSPKQFTEFLGTIFTYLKAYTRDGAIQFVCMDWRHIAEITTASAPHFELQNHCVWNKDNGGMGSLYRSKHELVFVFKNGTAPHINNVELGKHGRYRTNVWNYAGANSLSSSRSARLAMHPTVKPVALIADAIKDCSRRGDWILDPFGGSGSTLIAAQTTGRHAALIELDPAYVDVMIRRFERLTGIEAHNVGEQATFKEVTTRRHDEQTKRPHS